MNMYRAKLVCGLCLVLAAGSLGAQQPKLDDSAAADASAAYDAKDWAKAAPLYARLVKEHPEVARLWYRLADAQLQLGLLDQALDTMQSGLKAGVPPVFAEFLIGSIYAQKNEKDKAFEHLKIAVDNGFNKP